MNTPTPSTDTEITLTGAYTCTHHNDQQRAACPVCLVTALTAERDQLRADAASQRLHGGLIFRLTAERDQLRAELAELHDSFAGNVHTRCNELRDKLAAEREKAERYRLATLKLDAELAAERAQLDWVFRNCKVEADDFTTGNRDVYAIHDREDLGAAMKEDAK
jgi:hypothetical protein